MAVLQMQHISIFALKKDRKQILELLQRLGVIEIKDAVNEDVLFQKTDLTNSKSIFDKNVTITKNALEILDNYAKEEKPFLSGLNGRTIVTADVYDAFHDKYEEVLKMAKDICGYEKIITECKTDVLKLEEQLEAIKPWIALDIPVNFQGTRKTVVYNGSLQNEWSEEAIYKELESCKPVHVEIISKTREQTCIFVISLKEQSVEVLDNLRKIGFAKPAFTISDAPAQQQASILKRIEELKTEEAKAKENIIALAQNRGDISFLADYDTMRGEKYEVIGHLLQSKNIFILTGFIPVREKAALEEAIITKFDIAISYEDVRDDEEVPVQLSNNAFSAPLEGVIEAYSPPGKGEADPTFAVSLFYYMLFGIMFSDAGYGALMSIGCAIILKKKTNMEQGMKKMLQMFFFCGIATVFWGVIFGSFFGDAATVIAATFFNRDFTIPPLWFNPSIEPMRMLTFAMVIGIIHLFSGLLMKGMQYIRQKDIKGLIYDVVSWYSLLIGSILVLMSMQMFVDILGINFVLPGIVGNVGAALALIGSAIIILTNGRESRSPFKRLLKGLYAFYGITGYLSDVLSYSRLLALGLATGVIGSVINKMAAMTGNGIVGVILFTVIFLAGHTLNIGINVLGAYVHTNRLQYVEFFGKFYEGGGRMFNPFKVNTKYYKFKEKMNNE